MESWRWSINAMQRPIFAMDTKRSFNPSDEMNSIIAGTSCFQQFKLCADASLSRSAVRALCRIISIAAVVEKG